MVAMKHYKQPRSPFLSNIDSASSPTPPCYAKPRPSRKKFPKENIPPSDPNVMPSDSKPSPAKLKPPLPPRPPSSNPLKRKLGLDTVPENATAGSSDYGVKVVIRMRPPHKDRDEGDVIVQKISNDSLSILGQNFTFDTVAGTEATQLDIFQQVGTPLVENCLAGFNSSVFAYGQTGSGKTYTMWGPANALSDENIASDQQGLTPRVFERLFARINEEQIKYADTELKYQCHCSFLEIYNEQITDLLDPNQRNLQIREDVKAGVYVENLTEKYVCTLKDVNELLKKGFSNRRTGATSINAESSRSHTVFTCVVESRSKRMEDGICSFKTSRINLVDLAGSERQKLTGAAGDRLKEAGNINRSLSQLGNLINVLAEVSQTGKQRHIPYRDSKLTFLLQESLGGNAKLAMVCAISPTQSCKSETSSTLRFAQRAKAIKNKAVVNEVMHDDVNQLREVIRQLKDELKRIKANGGNNAVETNGGQSAAWIHRSLHLLKASLNRPLTLPRLDDDGDEEMEIDEEAVEQLCVQVGLSSTNGESNNIEARNVEEQSSQELDVNMEEGISEQDEVIVLDGMKPVGNATDCSANTLDQNEASELNIREISIHDEGSSELVEDKNNIGNDPSLTVGEPLRVSADIAAGEAVQDSQHESQKGDHPSSLSVVPCDGSPVLRSPTPSVSPEISSSRKSLRTSTMFSASQKDIDNDITVKPDNAHLGFSEAGVNCSLNGLPAQTSSHFRSKTEQLAASISHGLEILDSHRRSAALRRSSFRFSLRPESKSVFLVNKVDAGVQTFLPDHDDDEDGAQPFPCKCMGKMQLGVEDINDSSKLQLVPVDGSESAEKSLKLVPKRVERVLTGSIRREMALEDLCAKQDSEIMKLNRLVQQYKHERECNAIIAQTREEKILRLESLMDGVLPTEEFMEEELLSLTQEHKLLKEKYENHPEVLMIKIELQRVQNELEKYRNFVDGGEREVLLEEIQDLRSQLQFYIDSSSTSLRKQNSSLQLTYSCEPSSAPSLGVIPESTEESAEAKLEQERVHWNEVESRWISISEELRSELEASRSLAEKMKVELETERKCAEELKEAMQMAMEGHARMLEQYADLQEKHIQLLARHRRIQEGIDDVKKAASKAGVRGAESKFINALAAEISALKAEREKERRYFRDENKGLQAQLRDTAEAVQAAGELLVRLKEAEEAVTSAQKRAMEAEQEAVQAYKQIEKLKRKHANEVNTLNELLIEARLAKESTQPAYDDNYGVSNHEASKPQDNCEQKWKEEFSSLYNAEDSELAKPPSSWFSDYDRCNI